jgi:ketosteroid isomerase-like protein
MSKLATDLVLRYFDAFNRRDFAMYERLFTPDCVIKSPGMEAAGLPHMQGFDKVWTGALPDGKIENVVIAATGNTVLTVNRIHGHHTGTFELPTGPLRATGNTFDEEYMTRFEVAGERIRLQHLHFDRVRVMEVFGGLPVR